MVLEVTESKVLKGYDKTPEASIKVSSFINCVFVPQNMSSESKVDVPVVTYSADSKSNAIDSCNAFMRNLTPEYFENKIPEEFFNMTSSSSDLDTDNSLAYKNLPRTSDGKIDVQKIKASMLKAKELIQAQNQRALEEMNYGVYREAINSVSCLEAFLGLEIADFVKKGAKDAGVELPEFLTADTCLFDNEILNGFLSYMPDSVKEFLEVESSVNIRNDIKKQNESLENLYNYEIKSEKEAKIFLEKYLEVTGTTFSCKKIENYYELSDNEKISQGEKLEMFNAAFGLSSNYINATKNKILTDVIYDVGLRMILPTLINKSFSHPAVKGVSTALPTIIELAETATKSRATDEYVNLSNFTYDSTMEILADGALRGFLINLPNASWGKNLLGKSSALKCFFSPDKGSVANNIFLKAFVTKPYVQVNKVAIKDYLTKMNKLLLPNIFAEDGIYRVLSPEYNAYKISENEWCL